MTEKYRLQFRFLNGFIPPEMVVDVSEVGLPEDRKTWTQQQKEAYASAAFKQGTGWLIDAALGDAPWPGEMGEADEYWKTLQDDRDMLIDEGRISYVQGSLIPVANLQGINKYVDPRSAVMAWQTCDPELNSRPYACTLTVRDRKDGKGLSYTLGSLPGHPQQEALDYTAGVFDALTQAERERNPEFDGWGGRATVGGSSWNCPSLLSPEEVIQIVVDQLGGRNEN